MQNYFATISICGKTYSTAVVEFVNSVNSVNSIDSVVLVNTVDLLLGGIEYLCLQLFILKPDQTVLVSYARIES